MPFGGGGSIRFASALHPLTAQIVYSRSPDTSIADKSFRSRNDKFITTTVQPSHLILGLSFSLVPLT